MTLSESTHPRTHQFPERVLQFGTGVLLRGLCDFVIDKANKNGFFRGSIVVVKSMGTNIDAFVNQDHLYTCCVRGIEKAEVVHKNVVVSAISRVLTAENQWEEILKTAENENIDLVISNTTEVGLEYETESFEDGSSPKTYPGKLVAWLKRRFDAGKPGVIVVPTELLVDNGQILKSVVMKHIKEHKMDEAFTAWVKDENKFCSSLVDRIVPGKPKDDELKELYHELGYEDGLLIKAEAYKLWAIEGDDEIEERLSFADGDPGVIIQKKITQYRELKLRMLNAPHIMMSGICYLSGFETVKDAMADPMMDKYITILMLTEMAPSVDPKIHSKVVQRYGRDIIDRFRNPYLDHKWLSITFQYTAKIKMRAIPLLMSYYDIFESVPHYFARGMAAYIFFMKATKEQDGKYYGENEGTAYLINDDQAAWFYEVWQSNDVKEIVHRTLSNEEFWEIDLTHLTGFEEAVATHLGNMMLIGVREVVSTLNVYA
ncbi:tagaturonate reductase [Marinilongibacter aquaticus]|uniref:tagaturonate reductase n=1 Tax=Marinilongibacter aquaticus TaxID=2975157 RepID=UPI0021BD2823|nr:tagaturonate reductase [Marinilongibacter aquaticus]UBM57594.1 tagaturonate reductase [Marinilongibacter aquaticus]